MRSFIFAALLTIAAAHPTSNGLGVGRRSLVHVAPHSGRAIGSGNGVGLVERSNDQSVPPLRRAIDRSNRSIEITNKTLTSIDPTSGSNCTLASFPDECRTYAEAVPHINESFEKYNITTKPEAAAILSLIMFESGSFKFNIHHFPSINPGQGTRNMMNSPFIIEYAHEVFEGNATAIKLLPALNDTNVSDLKKNETLHMVLGDEYSFATGAWFYQRHCDEAVKVGVRNGTEEGWSNYIVNCVGTAVDSGREKGWTKAMEVI